MADGTMSQKSAKKPLTHKQRVGLGVGLSIGILAIAAAVALGIIYGSPATPLISLGYAPMYATFRPGKGWFAPYRVNPSLYTHLVMAFMMPGPDQTLYMPDVENNEAMNMVVAQYRALRDGCDDEVFCTLPKGCNSGDTLLPLPDMCGGEEGCLGADAPCTLPKGCSTSANNCTNIWKNFARNVYPPNKDMKILVSVGGWSASSPDRQTHHTAFHSALVDDPPNARQNFVNNCVQFVVDQRLDGVDLDIEYPGAPQGIHDADTLAANKGEVAGFTILTQLLGTALRKLDKVLTIAVGLGFALKYSYDWPALGKSCDHIHLMAYDLHGSPFDPVTGPNAPLMNDFVGAQPATFYIDYAVSYIMSHGVPPEKLVLGLAAYGRTFPSPEVSATDPYGKQYKQYKTDNTGASKCMINTTDGAWPGAITQTKHWGLMKYDKFNELTDPITMLHAADGVDCGVGIFTNAQGTLAYYEIMDIMNDQNITDAKVNTLTDTAYTYFSSGGPDGPQWTASKQFPEAKVLVSFDSLETLATKCQYALDRKMGGVMVWTIADDDMNNGFPVSVLMSSYMKKRGRPSNMVSQAAFLASRDITEVECTLCARSEVTVMPGGWSVPGTLGGYQQVGQHNCGCLWDWSKVLSAKNPPEVPSTSPCVDTGEKPTPLDACKAVQFGMNCYLQPGDEFNLSNFQKGASIADQCGAYYPKTYQPHFCSNVAQNPHSCNVCNTKDDCNATGLPVADCLATRDSSCADGWCSPEATGNMACLPCSPEVGSSCDNHPELCQSILNPTCRPDAKVIGCCPNWAEGDPNCPNPLQTEDMYCKPCTGVAGMCGYCDGETMKIPVQCGAKWVMGSCNADEQKRCTLYKET